MYHKGSQLNVQATRARNLASSIVKWSKDPANHESLAQMSGYIYGHLANIVHGNHHQDKKTQNSQNVGFVPSIANLK